MHGYKTFALCLLALLGFFAVALLQRHEVTGGDLALVIGAVAGLYGINDLAGGYRERQRQPPVPETVIRAGTLNADVDASTTTTTNEDAG